MGLKNPLLERFPKKMGVRPVWRAYEAQKKKILRRLPIGEAGSAYNRENDAVDWEKMKQKRESALIALSLWRRR